MNSTPINRYIRQIILPELGKDGQQQLSNAKALCVGAGGLGAPALMHLASSGIGTIGIVEDDVVELTNLQRQILYDENDLQSSKIESAIKKLSIINSNIKLIPFPTKLAPNNAISIIQQFDIILDCTDNIASKLLINDCAVKLQIPMIYGSVHGFDGYMAVFSGYNHAFPCYRCLYPSPNPNIPNCNDSGVLGPIPGIIGAMQALECIKLIIAKQKKTHQLQVPIGTLFYLDGLTLSTRKIIIPKNPKCPICSITPSNIHIDKHSYIKTTPSIPSISTSDLKALHNIIYVDIRDENIWKLEHLPNAINFPLSKILKGDPLPNALKNIEKTIVVYCQYGISSELAASSLSKLGLENIFHLKGGFAANK